MGANELSLACERAIERVLAPLAARIQPRVLDFAPAAFTAAIGSLALGGAERIVLDWAEHCARRHRVRLVVLRDASEEWNAPAGVEVIRLHGTDVHARLRDLGADLVLGGNRVIYCHLLNVEERRALASGRALPVPVLHNARAGWIEAPQSFSDAPYVISVSHAAKAEARASGCRAACTVIPHLPQARRNGADARRYWRARWALPKDAFIIGMIGAVKPQKAYPRALRVLAELLRRRAAYLAIIGGPTGRDGMLAWRAVLAQAQRLEIAPFVRLPGFVREASQCLPAFDVFLNTSRYEGRSIATLEALAAGLPTVATQVGGQGEIPTPGLTLLAFDAPDSRWASAIVSARGLGPQKPAWIGFPSHRLWTLCHAAEPFQPQPRVLFVTANLNAGGAQRSLTRLACALNGHIPLEIAVCGNSTADAFSRALRAAGVEHYRTAESRDCFDHAEALVRSIAAYRPSIVCFWNVDPKVKLLLVKALGFTRIKFADVSPGAYAFEEMRGAQAFQQWTAFSEREYYARLDRLVLKFRSSLPDGIRVRTAVISNGVPPALHSKRNFDFRNPKVVVSGRIAPSKFLLEIAAAMRLVWKRFPGAELHVLGTAEQLYRDYARKLVLAAGEDLDRRIVLHGPAFDSPERLADFDVALVLGDHQGCPNAALEALAAGLPVLANDSGGTSELVIRGRTGLLVQDCDPQTIAAGLAQLFSDPALAMRLSKAGRAHVARRFSMKRMTDAYLRLFRSMYKLQREGPCSESRCKYPSRAPEPPLSG